jgi:hypothetical protein
MRGVSICTSLYALLAFLSIGFALGSCATTKRDTIPAAEGQSQPGPAGPMPTALYFSCLCENRTKFESHADPTYQAGSCQLSTCSAEDVCDEIATMYETKCSPVGTPHPPDDGFESESCRRHGLGFACSKVGTPHQPQTDGGATQSK